MANPKFGSSLRGGQYPDAPQAISCNPGRMAENPLLDVSVWAVTGDIYFGCPTAEPMLKPGFYSCNMSQRGPYLERMKMATDALLELPDPVCDMLLGEFVEFWKRSPQFANLGLTTKRGLILWGPPGSGKTSAVQRMAAHMINTMGGVVVMAGDPEETTMCLHMLRKIEPDRPLIVVYEDLDALVQRYGEARFLAMLDGELQVSGVVNVATTNYPERLDKRFVDRPGRFDRVTFVGMPQEKARAAYFAAKALNVDEVTRARWVNKTEGWSIAHLRELIVATQVLGEAEDVTIKRLTEMQEDLNSMQPPEEDMTGQTTLVRKGHRRIGL
jgi:energy-coupling factor transporter ATP-binding protein EcfA2